MPVVVARIEPRLHSFGRASWALIERDDRLPCGAQAVVRDRKEGTVHMLFVLAEHLYNVPVGLRARQLEYICSHLQHLARNLNRTAESDDGLLVHFASSGARDHPAQNSKAEQKNQYRFRSVHFLVSPLKIV